jgi:hypothetical protein
MSLTNLPDETLLRILRLTATQRTVKGSKSSIFSAVHWNVLLICRKVYPVAVEAVYECVYVTGFTRARQLVSVLHKSPTIASYVRILGLDDYTYPQMRALELQLPLIPRCVELWTRPSRYPVDRGATKNLIEVILTWASVCPRLRILAIEGLLDEDLCYLSSEKPPFKLKLPRTLRNLHLLDCAVTNTHKLWSMCPSTVESIHISGFTSNLEGIESLSPQLKALTLTKGVGHLSQKALHSLQGLQSLSCTDLHVLGAQIWPNMPVLRVAIGAWGLCNVDLLPKILSLLQMGHCPALQELVVVGAGRRFFYAVGAGCPLRLYCEKTLKIAFHAE